MCTQKHINYTAPGHPGSRLSPGGRTKIWIRYAYVFVDNRLTTGTNYVTGHCLNRKCLKRTAELMSDSDIALLRNQKRKRRRLVVYPQLHEALFVWMKAIEKVVTITGPILKLRQLNYSLGYTPAKQHRNFSMTGSQSGNNVTE